MCHSMPIVVAPDPGVWEFPSTPFLVNPLHIDHAHYQFITRQQSPQGSLPLSFLPPEPIPLDPTDRAEVP